MTLLIGQIDVILLRIFNRYQIQKQNNLMLKLTSIIYKNDENMNL